MCCCVVTTFSLFLEWVYANVVHFIVLVGFGLALRGWDGMGERRVRAGWEVYLIRDWEARRCGVLESSLDVRAGSKIVR
jgi:hypothetical protein